MKRKALLVLVLIVILLFGACSAPEPIDTELGEFHYEQAFTKQLDDETASDGNIYMVLYLTPAEETQVTLDEAQDYFFSGTKAEVSAQTYDMEFLVFEKIDGEYVRFGLVFEVVDYDYEEAKEQPIVKLMLP